MMDTPSSETPHALPPQAEPELASAPLKAPDNTWTAAARLVGNAPGLTCAELARVTLEDQVDIALRYRLMRALPEAMTHAVIHGGDIRRCSVTGAYAQTWYPGAMRSNECHRAA
jgi:hypothetical protein